MGHGWMKSRLARSAVLVVAGLALCPPAAGTTLAVSGGPNDPYFSQQWNLMRIGAPAAWASGTGAGEVIGVVDTGVDLGHADLAGKVLASTNCIGANDDPSACHGTGQDDQGHGTQVSGIAAADTNNGIGVAGVAPGAHLVVAKALSAKGSGALTDVNAGIKWVVDHGAGIVILSVEADSSAITGLAGQSLAEGVEYAWKHGAVAVVAAGNATPSLFGGAAYATVDAMVVGATGPDDELAFYSNAVGVAKWGLVAPGGDVRGRDGRPSCAGSLAARCIVSTGWFSGRTNQYAEDEGTSMAAPHVAGALAVLMGAGHGLTREAAVQRILATAAPASCGAGCHGRLDLAAAVHVPPGSGRTASGDATAVAPPPPPPPPSAGLSAGRSQGLSAGRRGRRHVPVWWAAMAGAGLLGIGVLAVAAAKPTALRRFR